jgi:ribosomal protein S18 acetylase RimI-like enzyme
VTQLLGPPRLRRATQADAPLLAELIDISNFGADRPDMEGALRNILAAGSDVGYANALIAEIDGEAAAAAMLNAPRPVPPPGEMDPVHAPYEELKRRASDHLYLRNIACLPQMRGRGAARALVIATIEMARLIGAPGVSAIVHARNTPMHGLFGSNGFRRSALGRIDSHPAFPAGVGIDLWVRAAA